MEKNEPFAVLPHRTMLGFDAFCITDSRGRKSRDKTDALRVFNTREAAEAARDRLRIEEPEAYLPGDVWLVTYSGEERAVEIQQHYDEPKPDTVYLLNFGDTRDTTVNLNDGTGFFIGCGEPFPVEFIRRLWRKGA